MHKWLILVTIILSLLAAGCTQQGLEDNQVYVVEQDTAAGGKAQMKGQLDTEGSIPFQQYQGLEVPQDVIGGRVLLTLSPDGKSIYLMEPMPEDGRMRWIKGAMPNVRLLKVDLKSREEKSVIEDIPFVSRVEWNEDGAFVAFGGGERLTVYEAQKDRLVMEDTLQHDQVAYFFWSPRDKNKIYTEQPDLANGSIYYIDARKKVEAYETREGIYFKGKLDNDYYYGTNWYVAGEGDKTSGKSDSISTVIVDKQGNIVKTLGEGKFRASYKKSLAQVGEGGFGLSYITDVNNPEKVKLLSGEFIFDVKFVNDGKIAYITSKEDPESNLFLLHIIDPKGKELAKLEVSGSSFALLPDGKTGYIGGPGWEGIDFTLNEITTKTQQATYETGAEQDREALYKAIRGAMDTIYKYELVGERDFSAAKQYFVDTHAPEQWAYFDVVTKFNETDFPRAVNRSYNLQLELLDLQFPPEVGRASVKVRVAARNSSGGGQIMNHALEMINLEGHWFVTGFSTFPASKVREELLQSIAKYLQEAQEGKIFPGELEGKEVEIGQIQFWRSSMTHLSPDMAGANLCKVYLRVKSGGQEKIYKMLLDRKNQNYWKATGLSQENLSYF